MLKFFTSVITVLTFICCLCIVAGIPIFFLAYLFDSISQIYIRIILVAVLTVIPIFLAIFSKKELLIFNITYVCAALMFIVGWFIPHIGFDDYSKDDGWLIAIYPPIWLFSQFFYMPITLYFRRNSLRKRGAII